MARAVRPRRRADLAAYTLIITGGPIRAVVGQNSICTLDVGRQGGEARRQCTSYSLCWALCALRWEPAWTSFLRTWRYDSNSSCSVAARSALGLAPRSTLLDMALAAVGAVARDAQCGSPRDRDSLAQAGLPRILELEVPARPNRETARRLRGRKARPHHGPRQSPRRRDRQASLLREPGRV